MQSLPGRCSASATFKTGSCVRMMSYETTTNLIDARQKKRKMEKDQSTLHVLQFRYLIDLKTQFGILEVTNLIWINQKVLV